MQNPPCFLKVDFAGILAARIYVDKGYRGHDYKGGAEVILSGRKRGLTPQMKRELKRRSAIEATIGHMKTDGRLDRNFLKGQTGDAINALLCAAGHNMRLVLSALEFWLVSIILALIHPFQTENIKTYRQDKYA